MKCPDKVQQVARLVIQELYPQEGEVLQNIPRDELRNVLIVFYQALVTELRRESSQ
jgi:hypothetical protein